MILLKPGTSPTTFPLPRIHFPELSSSYIGFAPLDAPKHNPALWPSPLNFWSITKGEGSAVDWPTTQFEIERSCGQSMTNFRFFSSGGQNNFTVFNFFFSMCLVWNLQEKWETCPKPIQLWLCVKYCTDRLLLGHVRLFNLFLELKLKPLEAR